MKHSPNVPMLALCFFFISSHPLYSQNELGLRLFYQNNLTQTSDSWGQGQDAGEWELGVFARHQFTHVSAIRLEVNALKARYKLTKSKHYGSLKICAIPEWKISRVFSIGAGGFLNFGLFDALDIQKKVESGAALNASMRYNRVEIQCRFQTTFVAVKEHSLGAGLAWYFGKKASR